MLQFFGQKESVDRAGVEKIYGELCDSFDMDMVYNHRTGSKAWFFFDLAEDFAYVHRATTIFVLICL